MKMTHRLDAIAYVDDDNSSGIMHIVYDVGFEGVKVVGNGTCSRPLGVKLTGAYAIAPQLAKVLKDALDRLEAVDRALLERTGSRFECEIGEVKRGRDLLMGMPLALYQPRTESVFHAEDR